MSTGSDYELIVVAYRSRPLVEQLLRSVPPEVPVVVVDNAHGVDGLEEVAAARPATRYLDGPGHGFASGANRGALTSSREFVVFVNPDSSPTLDQLEALVGDLRADPALAAVGATTVQPDGRIEIGVGGWEPTVLRTLVHVVGAHKLFPTAGLWARPVPGRPMELEWLSGACLAVRRDVFAKLGGFDESFFVYNEDVAFGRQVREAGLRQKLRTDLLVPHVGAGSGGARTRMVQQRSASFLQYVRRHNPRTAVEAMRLALSAGFLARVVLCRVRGRTTLAREHLAYVRGLWRGAPDLA